MFGKNLSQIFRRKKTFVRQILIKRQTHFQENITFFRLNVNKTSTTPSCSVPIPAQKSRGNSVLGVVFSHRMPEKDFRYSYRFS